jgi:tripartite-type tricarboxylate transporter receptor subunit TctC
MGSHVAAPVLTPNLKYDSARDFEPIGLTVNAPAVIVARKDFPAKDLRDFVSTLKAKGEGIRQAHGGIGSSSHMACLLFTSAASVQPTLVAYRGVDQAVTNLVGGHVDFFCDAAVTAASHIASGTLKAYAVSGMERLGVLPEVPTAMEADVNYQMSIWAGMFAPKGTPKDIVARLAQALDRALEDPAIRKRVGDLGGSIPAQSERNPGSFAAFVAAEIARWSPILRAAATAKTQ